MDISSYYTQLMRLYFKHMQTLFGDGSALPEDLKERTERCVQRMQSGEVTELEFEQFVAGYVQTFNDPMFVWKMLQNATMSHFLGHLPVVYLCSSSNLESCINEFLKYKALFFPPSYLIDIYPENEKYVIDVRFEGNESPVLNIKADTALCTLLWVFRQVGGVDFDYQELVYPIDRKDLDLELIGSLSSASVSQKGAEVKAVFPKSDVKRKNLFFDAAMHRRLGEELEALRISLMHPKSFVDSVVGILQASGSPASLTQEKVAEQLGKSLSTFRRMLAAEDCTFKQVQNNVIDQIAIDSLLSSDIKIEVIGLQLGYTDRTTFERAFKRKFGQSPAQFRGQGRQLSFREKNYQFLSIVNDMPPLPSSCQSIIAEFNNPNLNVEKIINILGVDPIFSGRIMGLASRAIYGRKPESLYEAVSRNLGVETVKNLALVYATNDLQAVVTEGIDVDKITAAIIASPEVFNELSRQSKDLPEHDRQHINQLLMFSLLSIFLIFNKTHIHVAKVREIFYESKHLIDFIEQLESKLSLSIFGISGVLLSAWGIDEEIIRRIIALDQVLLNDHKVEKIALLALSTSMAKSFDQQDAKSHLEKIASDLGIENYNLCFDHTQEYL